MAVALPGEVMKLCVRHGRLAPLHRFEYKPGPLCRSGDYSPPKPRCQHLGCYGRICLRCYGIDHEAETRAAAGPDALGFWERTGARRLAQHLPKWSTRRKIRDREGNKVEVGPFVPPFDHLPSEKRTQAQLDWLAKRRQVTVGAVGAMLYKAYREEKCPGRCGHYFRDYPPNEMQLAVKDPKVDLTMDELFALCRMENQQMGTLAWADLLDQWFWDNDCVEGRSSPPTQKELFAVMIRQREENQRIRIAATTYADLPLLMG